MASAFDLALSSNPCVQLFELCEGPYSDDQVTGIAVADMVDIPCDAYVVPQFRDDSSQMGVAFSVASAGGLPGLLEYIDYVDGQGAKGLAQQPGEARVTKSGGGRSTHLINVVSIGERDNIIEVTSASVTSALMMANEHGLKRIVFPPLGLSQDRAGIKAADSADAMFGAIYGFWREHPTCAPSEVLVTLVTRDVTLVHSFRKALQEQHMRAGGKGV